MTIRRAIGYAPRTTRLAEEVSELGGPCVGCTGCPGLCAALLEALTVPSFVLGRGRDG